MKKILFCLAVSAVLPVHHAVASPVDFSIGVNIGNRPQPVVVAPAPPVPQPVYDEPRIVVDEPPLFIEPPELGFHVSVGTPQDIIYIGNRYYLCRQNVWYAAPHYRGPWVATRYSALPWKLRKHPYERIRHYRDEGYRQYSRGHNPYWERHHFRPSREWKEARWGDRKSWQGRDDRERSRYAFHHRDVD